MFVSSVSISFFYFYFLHWMNWLLNLLCFPISLYDFVVVFSFFLLCLFCLYFLCVSFLVIFYFCLLLFSFTSHQLRVWEIMSYFSLLLSWYSTYSSISCIFSELLYFSLVFLFFLDISLHRHPSTNCFYRLPPLHCFQTSHFPWSNFYSFHSYY